MSPLPSRSAYGKEKLSARGPRIALEERKPPSKTEDASASKSAAKPRAAHMARNTVRASATANVFHGARKRINARTASSGTTPTALATDRIGAQRTKTALQAP